MSNFLDNLAARSLGLAIEVKPRIRSLFEPQAAQQNQPARFSVHLPAEHRADRDQEPSHRAVVGFEDPSASTVEHTTRQNSITSSLNASVDASAKQTDERDAVSSYRVEPAHARGSTYTVSVAPTVPVAPAVPVAPKGPLDLSRPRAPAASVARTLAGDRLTNKADPAPQSRNEREVRPTVVHDVHGRVDNQINPLEPQRPPGVKRAEQVQASQPAAVSAARTIMPAQAERAPELPVIHLHSPAAAAGSPEIKITIGRVEVRAIMPAAPAPPRAAGKKVTSRLSLDEYLKQRKGALS